MVGGFVNSVALWGPFGAGGEEALNQQKGLGWFGPTEEHMLPGLCTCRRELCGEGLLSASVPCSAPKRCPSCTYVGAQGRPQTAKAQPWPTLSGWHFASGVPRSGGPASLSVGKGGRGTCVSSVHARVYGAGEWRRGGRWRRGCRNGGRDGDAGRGYPPAGVHHGQGLPLPEEEAAAGAPSALPLLP